MSQNSVPKVATEESGTPFLYKKVEESLLAENPWAGDELGRKVTAEKLTKIIATITQPFVISIDGKFGAGKTFFLKRWAQSLKNDGCHVVYFNAWETDFANDPLMAFLSVFDKELFRKSILSKDVKTAGKSLLKSVAFNVISAATLGAVITAEDLAKAEDAAKTVQIKRYKDFAATMETIEKFKQALEAYGDKLKEADVQKRPIVVIIDELDRCRPNYAIEVLETIKHLFNCKNYVFVLGIDRQQLGSSFSAIYGEGLDKDAYLRKFIDWNYVLPEPKSEKYVRSLYKAFKLDQILKPTRDAVRGGEDFVEAFSELAASFNLSTREIEQYMTSLNLLLRFFGERQAIFPMLLVILVMLRDKDHEIYKKYCLAPGEYKLLIDYLSQRMNIKNDFGGSTWEWVRSWIIACSIKSIEQIHSQLEAVTKRLNGDQRTPEDEQEYDVLERVKRITGSLNFNYGISGTVAKYLYDHIEDISRS